MERKKDRDNAIKKDVMVSESTVGKYYFVNESQPLQFFNRKHVVMSN